MGFLNFAADKPNETRKNGLHAQPYPSPCDCLPVLGQGNHLDGFDNLVVLLVPCQLLSPETNSTSTRHLSGDVWKPRPRFRGRKNLRARGGQPHTAREMHLPHLEPHRHHLVNFWTILI